jgi:biopolymer transport protein ExbB/TolQ
MNMQTLSSFLEHGGFTSILIIVTALALIGLSIDRLSLLFLQMTFNSEATMDKLRELILKKAYSQAVQLCNLQGKNPELAVVRAGLIAAENGREAMKSALGESILKVTQQCERRLPYISLIASSATLLGLLGTISGLIKTFSGLASADAAEKSKLLGGGIAEAMNATAMGLLIGLGAMVVHTICISKTDELVAKAQRAALSFSTWIEHAERIRKNG